MKVSTELGKTLYHQMYDKFLEVRNQIEVKKHRKSSNEFHKINTISLSHQNKILTKNESKIEDKNWKSCCKRKDTEKLLQMYKSREQQELRNPFNKIHIKRPQSAANSARPSVYVEKQNNSRYQQLKQYYQNKYCEKKRLKIGKNFVLPVDGLVGQKGKSAELKLLNNSIRILNKGRKRQNSNRYQ